MKPQQMGTSYRGPSAYVEANLGVGGNQIMDAKTGTTPGTMGLSGWHPTVVYLIGLLVIEWAVFIWINKYL